MRVKVKLTSSPQAVYKVDLGEGPLTLARVQEVITQHVSDAHLSEDAQLSLNKKSPISTDPNATLQSLGVCSGDLLWILTGPAPAISPAVQPAHQKTTPLEPQPDKRARNDSRGAHALEVDQPCPSLGALPLEASYLSRLLATQPPQPRPSPHQLLLLAVQAAMQEAGFTIVRSPTNQRIHSADQLGGGQPEARAPPAPVFAHGLCRMTFNWGSQQARMAAATANAQAGAEGVAPAPQCHIMAVPMGHFLVVHAKAQGIRGPGAAQGTDCKSNLRTMHLDSHALVDKDRLQQDTPLTPGVFKGLHAFWMLLKDELALWAATRAHQAVGLAAPVGLLVLPFELKDKILCNLEVRDLSVLACVCMELRQLADADHLWKPPFLREFPNASLEERSMAERLGYKQVYITLWRARRQRQRRALAQSHIRPGYGPPMPGPMFPSRGPTYPPNIIGGDYDRLPGGPSYGGMMPSFGMLGGIRGPPLPGGGDPLALGPRMGGGGGFGGLMGSGRNLRGGGARGDAGRHFF